MMAKAAPLKVLVVDDEPAIRRFLRTSLTAQGYLVTEAENGIAALEDLRRGPIDILVLDLGLPDLDGEVWVDCRVFVRSLKFAECEPVAPTSPSRLGLDE